VTLAPWTVAIFIAVVVVIVVVVTRPNRESRLVIARSLQERARSELRDGHGDQALATIRSARKTIDDPKLAYSEALIANYLRKSTDAETAASAAAQGPPDVAEAAYALLTLLAHQRGDADEASRLLQEGLKRFPKSSLLLERHAQQLFQAGDKEGSERALMEIEEVGDSSKARGMRAESEISALARHGQLHEAIERIDEAVADGAMSWGFVGIASSLLCRGGHPDDALSLIDRAEPDFAPEPAWIRNRVWALCLLGRVDEAVSIAERSPDRTDRDSDYDRAIAAETRAIAYVYARNDLAEPHLRWLLRFEPDDEDLRSLLERSSADGRSWRDRLEGSRS
jgi:tetratricopeptide (TPR) repeat protein